MVTDSMQGSLSQSLCSPKVTQRDQEWGGGGVSSMSTSLPDAATLQRLSRSFSVVKDGPLLKHTQSPEEV